jgi:hypothetical protein
VAVLTAARRKRAIATKLKATKPVKFEKHHRPGE